MINNRLSIAVLENDEIAVNMDTRTIGKANIKRKRFIIYSPKAITMVKQA